MRHLSIVAVVIAASVAGCGGGSDCTVPGNSTFMITAMEQTNSINNCANDIVVAAIDSLNGATGTFESTESCGNTTIPFPTGFTDATTNATCTGDGEIAFDNFESSGGSGDDTIDITCSDGTSCTEVFTVTFTAQ